MREDNFAMPRPYMPGQANTEIVCLTCGSKFYAPKILGPDNVYRMLPAFCRQCGPAPKKKEGGG